MTSFKNIIKTAYVSCFLLLGGNNAFASMSCNPVPNNESYLYTPYFFPSDLIATDLSQDKIGAFYPQNTITQKFNVKQNLNIDNVTAIINYDWQESEPLRGHGDANDRSIFQAWPFIDYYVSFGGNCANGVIKVPQPREVYVAHKNGIPILGSIMLPPETYGGNREWVDDFVKREDNQYLIVPKLAKLAEIYNFDGWFFNEEINNIGQENTSHFINIMTELRDNHGLLINWYDSINTEGNITYQNELNDGNKVFLESANFFFTNYWWYSWSSHLENSIETANPELDAKNVQMGINVWDEQKQGTINRLVLLENASSPIGVGLWAAVWPADSDGQVSTVNELQSATQNVWWGTSGIPTDANEVGWGKHMNIHSPITDFPFYTEFNVGRGDKYYLDGEEVSGGWSDLYEQDYLPINLPTTNDLTITHDFSVIENGGSSLLVKSTDSGFVENKLYYTDLPVNGESLLFNISFKASNDNNADVELCLNGVEGGIDVYCVSLDDPQMTNDWITKEQIIENPSADKITGISVKIQGGSANLNIGSIYLAVDEATTTQVQAHAIDTIVDNSVEHKVLTWSVNTNNDLYKYRVFVNNNYYKSVIVPILETPEACLDSCDITIVPVMVGGEEGDSYGVTI